MLEAILFLYTKATNRPKVLQLIIMMMGGSDSVTVKWTNPVISYASVGSWRLGGGEQVTAKPEKPERAFADGPVA